MAISTGVYANFLKHLGTASVNWAATDTIKCILMKAAHTPDFGAHDYLNDVEADKVPSTDQELAAASRTITITVASSYVDFGGVTVITFPLVAAAESAGGVIVYKARGGLSSADELICCLAFSVAKTTTGADVVVNFNAAGQIRFIYTGA